MSDVLKERLGQLANQSLPYSADAACRDALAEIERLESVINGKTFPCEERVCEKCKELIADEKQSDPEAVALWRAHAEGE